MVFKAWGLREHLEREGRKESLKGQAEKKEPAKELKGSLQWKKTADRGVVEAKKKSSFKRV